MRTVAAALGVVVGATVVLQAVPALAGNALYISQAGAGSKAGTSCANAASYAYFNRPSNWSSNPTGSTIGPGTTVHLCAETVVDMTAGDTALTFQCATATGTSSNPITLVADQGTVNLYDSAYWSGSNGAIGNTGTCSYVVVDGMGSVTIANQTAGGTATNGTGLAQSAQSYGVGLSGCTDCTVRNLTVQNIYVNEGSSPSATDSNGAATACIAFNGVATGSTIRGNTVSQCKVGVEVSADPNADASDMTVAFNTISDIDWGINVGGGDSGDTINNLVIHDNTITNWTNWAYPTSVLHQDGIILEFPRIARSGGVSC